jgi:polyferredoxin
LLFTGLRRIFQAGAFMALAVVAIRSRAGVSFDTCETLCPFGGAEGLFHLLREKQYLCVLSESNVTLFLGVLLLALAAKRVFCSHLCPLGFLSELLHLLRLKMNLKPLAVSAPIDGVRSGR